jgi:hypothetical protein
MFIKKNLKDFTVVLLTLLYLHIEFQDQIHKNKKTVKKIKFLTYLISQIYQKFIFLL